MSNNFFGQPGELEGRISDSGPVREWRRAICPICDKEYLYAPLYKPKTCQALDCARRLRDRNRRSQ